MPSGKTHDAITIMLAAPVFAAAFAATNNIPGSTVVTAAFIFGGVMFGPDLDTISRQYSRWLIFRFLWFPYRSFFKHRSRFSHGLIFGALIRVVYFVGALTLVASLAMYAYTVYSGGKFAGMDEFVHAWRQVGRLTRDNFGAYFLMFVFLGLWLGAASHTFTDMAGSFIKTGRVAKFL